MSQPRTATGLNETDMEKKDQAMNPKDLKVLLKAYTNSKRRALLLDANVVDKYHHHVAIGVFIVWFLLNAFVVVFVPTNDNFTASNRIELLTCALMMYSLIGGIIPRVILGPIAAREFKIESGVLSLALVVTFCAAISNAMLGFLPQYVFVDPITKCPVNILRWCEWVPLSFAMAFLTDGIDAEHISVPFKLASTLSMSTLIGSLMPFAQNFTVWIGMLASAIILFCNVYIRLYQKINRCRDFPKGVTVDEVEEYNRVFISTRLMCIGATSWTLLVLSCTRLFI